MVKHRYFSIAVSLQAMVLLAGCGSGTSAAKSSDRVFRVPLDVNLMSLDPTLVSDNWSIDVIQNTFEGLVAMGEDNRVHPCLAERWDISPDGRTYTFHLKHGVLFQNGREFKAEDVKRSLERSCGRELAAPLASDYLNDISGMKAFHSGASKSLSGVRLLDAYTVAVSIEAPHPYFLAKLSLPVASIVACEQIKDGLHIRSVDEMIGTGPFKIEKYLEGQILVQTAFDHYHGGRPKIDRIERPIMVDSLARLNAFKRGEIDMVQQLTRSDYADLLRDPAYKDELQLIPRATLVYLALDTSAWPNRRVRQAIAMAIDREIIATEYLQATVTPAKGILPRGVPGYRENPAWLQPNSEKAKQILKEEGHPDGVGLPELRISFAMENPDIERIADQIGNQLKDKLGIQTRLDKMETASLISKQNRKKLAAEVTGWFADYIDPQDFLSMLLTSGSSENHWNYSNRSYDSLCERADTSTDPVNRLKLYAMAEDEVLQDAVLIPICYWKTPILTSSMVHGVRQYAAEFLPYNTVWLK